MKIMNKILHSVFEVIYTAGAVQTQREDVWIGRASCRERV